MHIYAIFDKELLQDKGAEYAADLAGAKEILKTMHRTLVEQNDGAHHADLCIALIDVSTTKASVLRRMRRRPEEYVPLRLWTCTSRGGARREQAVGDAPFLL